jgi:general secretion pathway protein K
MTGARRDAGMILLNVLVIVALASALVAVMVLTREAGVSRAVRLNEAIQAQALAQGGETSVITALRRDAVVAPASDHLGEAWAKRVIQRQTAIAGGRFSLSVADGQGRFNLNSLTAGVPAQLDQWRRIAAAAGLSPDKVDRVAELLRARGALTSLAPLRQAGLDESALARLSDWVTVLPSATAINLNTAAPPLLSLLVEDRAKASLLVERRRARGYLTAEDLLALGLPLPPNTGFTSNYYWVSTTVTVGDTHQGLLSLIARRDKDVRVIQRQALR